jgi:hypothetical protein
MNDMHPERVALEAAVRAGLVPPALAREALERHAALGRAGQQANLLALVAERLDPRAREALAAYLRGARETVGGSAAPSGGPRSPSSFGAARPGPPAASLPGPGDDVGGYTIERELGRGGMGAVFAAVSPQGQRVALKLLLGVASAQATERFLREANAARKLQHPGIVGLHEAGVDARGRQFMAMQLVDGESLRERLEREGPLPSREAARITLQLARALESAHSQFVLHRDLKPHNVLLARDGSALLADFGLARDAHDARLTTTGELLGTPAYMAPEQAAGERGSVDARSDLYGLGATLYHMLAGRPPFEGPALVNIITSVLTRAPAPPSATARGVDPALEALCLRCLAKAPAERFQSAAALAHELERWLGTTDGAAPPRRGRAPAVAALAVGGLAVAAGVVLALRPPTPTSPATVESVETAAAPAPPPPVSAPTTTPTLAPSSTFVPPPGPEGALVAPMAMTTTPGGRERLRIDASNFLSLPNLELRDAWLIEPTGDGLWLRAQGPEARTGLCLQLYFERPDTFEVSVDVELTRLEPTLPLGIVWKQGVRHTASLGLVPQWTSRPDGSTVLEHGLTLLYQSPDPTEPALQRAGPFVALPPGPQRLELRLRYDHESERLVGSTKGGVLDTVTLPLARPLGHETAYVSLWLQGAEVFRPAPDPLWPLESSEVLVRSLELEGARDAIRARVGPWTGSRYGWLGRRSSDARELPAVLALLDEPKELKELGGNATKALFLAAMRCAASDAHRGRAVELLQRAATSAGGDDALWTARKVDVFALDAHQRRALLAWLSTWHGADLRRTAEEIVSRRGGRRAQDRDWCLAALVLSLGEAGPLPDETGEALNMAGGFAEARGLLRQGEAALRARLEQGSGAELATLGEELERNLKAQAFNAFRLRDFQEAQAIWRQHAPERGHRQKVFQGLPAHLR